MKGWAGNQLFQYATGRALSIRNNDTLKIDPKDFNRHAEKTNDSRKLDLLNFNIKAEVASDAEVKRLRDPLGLPSYIFRRLKMKFAPSDILNFDSSVLKNIGNTYLDGYFQSYKYFDSIKSELRNEITLKQKYSDSAAKWREQINQSDNSTSLHIRRGDYISNKTVHDEFGPCSIDYYKRALTEIESNGLKPTYFVFSDDLQWVKENLILPENRTLYVAGEDLKTVEELMLMSQCKNQIIANSSFSWWGAWLNPNSEKVVIAPTPWLNSGKIKEEDLIPSEWKTLPK